MKVAEYKTDNEVVLNQPAIRSCLVFDIETDGLNIETAQMKFFGCYSYLHEKYFLLHKDEHHKIQELIDEHRILIGFNNKDFDAPIMMNNGYEMEYKICFDGLKVLYDHARKRPNREAYIKMPNGKPMATLPNRKLKTVCEALGFKTTKGDIDYRIFQKDEWTKEELDEIYKYLYKDILLTRKLFEYYVEYFDSYKEYVNDKNIMNLNYIRTSFGSYAYSVLSHLAGFNLDFEDDEEAKEVKPVNHGGFVLDPTVSYAEGQIVYADFSSLYPHIMMMCNLFNPSPDGNWKGGKMFKGLLQTNYKDDEMGVIEKVLKTIYTKRVEFKKLGDPREQSLKVVINTIYGLSGSPIFKNVFNLTTSGDCTIIGRRMLNFTKESFEVLGFNVIYGDTDSCFVQIPDGKTLEDFKKICNIIVKNILDNVPFPMDSFKLDIDDVFKKVWLFKKKHYIGINNDDKLIIKGLSIIKHDSTKLSQKIFKRIKDRIIDRQSIKFPLEFINDMIKEELEEDITVIGREYNVKSPESYASKTSIQHQIASELGEGTHFLIKNTKIGNIGKGKKYCSAEDAMQLDIDDLVLDKTMKELEPFID